MDWTPRERYRRTAWSVAVSCAIETGEPAVDVYEKLMKKFDSKRLSETAVLDESRET
jgi:hypothetical protein